MDRSVLITQLAYDQLDKIVDHIAKDAPETARRWRDKILDDIDSLRHFPLRHGLAPEAQAVGVPLHQMMHGVYRVLYTVEESVVTVHGVRHGARRPLREDELPR